MLFIGMSKAGEFIDEIATETERSIERPLAMKIEAGLLLKLRDGSCPYLCIESNVKSGSTRLTADTAAVQI